MAVRVPKWKAEWDRLVGDAKAFEIKNWAKYQPDMEDGTSNPWFKSYSNTDEDEADETALVRWLKDSLRRWRARRGAPIVANMEAILMATSAHRTDRPHVPHAILTLISQRFLIPSNESFTPKSRGEKRRGEKRKEVAPPDGHKKTETGTSEPTPVTKCKQCRQVGKHSPGCPQFREIPVKEFVPTDTRNWSEDVTDGEGVIRAAHINRALAYKRKSGNEFFQKVSPAWVREHARELVNEVPPAALQPQYEAKPDPECEDCDGSGEIIVEDGLYQSSETCPCVKQVEIG